MALRERGWFFLTCFRKMGVPRKRGSLRKRGVPNLEETMSFLTFLVEVPWKLKMSLKMQKLVILATWKLGSVSPCFEKKSKKPFRYSESWVDSVRKICHQISSVASSSGGKISTKVECFFSRWAEKIQFLRHCQTLETWPIDL